jgi:hypothetical protein
VLASTPLVAQTRQEFCAREPLNLDSSAEHERTGRYINRTYGYSLTIPPGLTAFTDPSGPERGFVIVLSQMPRVTLRVSAGYDIFFDLTAEGVHRRDLNTIRLHDTLLSDRTEVAHFAHVAGGRYAILLQCRDESQVLWHEEIIVLRNREIYRLDLQSWPSRRDSDLKPFDAVLKSWRWVPVAPR